MGLNYGDLFEDWEIALAKAVISQFQADHLWLKTWEFDDLLQECLTHWYLKSNRYNSDRGASIKAYMRRVLKNQLCSLLRRELSDKRRVQHNTQSLDEPLGEGDITLGDILPSSIPDTIDKLDMASVINGLTPLQKQICQLLAENMAVSRIGRVLGISRHSIRRELGIIKQEFLKGGF